MTELDWELRESGPPDAECTVLLLPGGMCSSGSYAEVMAEPALAGTRLVAATLPGQAGAPPPDDYSVESYARLVRERSTLIAVIERGRVRHTCAVAWFVAGLVVLCGCTSSGVKTASSTQDTPAPSPTTTTTQPRLLPGHTSWIETFVDTSRRAVPATGAPLPSRTLATTIYRPNGAGPFPLILFSHGLDGHPEKFTMLFTAWVDAGFAVAAPAFPLTNSHADNPNSNVGDVAQQPADVSFVLDNLLAMNTQPKSRLVHAIDERKIGAGGLSLGGLTTYLLAYNPCCRDERVRAVEVLDGIRPDVAIDGHVPLLIAHSDTDPTIPYSTALEAFGLASPPAWLVTLHGALHASQWEDDATPYDHLAEQLTIDFWDATLNGNSGAFARLQQDATVPGLSSIVEKDPKQQ